MLHAKNLPHRFWAEAMSTAYYIHNRVTLRKGTSTTLYELWKGRKPTVKHFHVFGSKCYILVDREPRRKLDPKSEEGIFLLVEENIVKLEHVTTEDQVADIFTKALDVFQFERLRGKLGIFLHEEL
ncbi:retrotransposon-related protein [Trifolium pratense]|uniref:Retrotransposon-related protein n=1 Tax=Trifolium pratense TaxID=57577 RepID=A0A2K3K3K9_TRIPR|nr:retrotransposon-related protein [Trifolium pratense]